MTRGIISTRRRGHSLIELMVASALLMLLMGLIYQMFIAGKQYQDNCQAKMELQDNVMHSLAAINKDMAESDRNAITADSLNNATTFSSPRGLDGVVSFDSSGRMYWKKFVCYYVQPSSKGVSTLYRKSATSVVAPALYPTDVPPPPGTSVLRDDPTLPARQIAPNITVFNVTNQSDGTTTVNVTGELRLLIHTYGVQIQGSVLPTN